MKYGRYGWPYLFLRVGLGLTFLFIGVDILRHPTVWIGYVPRETMLGLDSETMLRIGGFFDMIVGTLLIIKAWPRVAGALATLHLIGIFSLNGIDGVLARNIGLLGAAIAVLVWPNSYRRRRWWWSKRRRWRGTEDEV
ncbi:MAG: hypothetical protein A3E37_02475 [Candidatus Andersenbacteria bacterium RIFCSPHIGHO2_12_FULL_46_9]|nr:MAG: hypothetical protein A3B76_03425 [Candidatus Andersenbacteria bacterium RIFCSPHIGHO2_02_FULL_46_16]OGY37391.1 MAG: hypothetical protein A3E37_02475 [Candidatus Andersenbacteria bacterium RIFCSPHIGHO2_12_FULL_46_9]OGY37468.1 MAG: hypothetical protein A3I08_00340 [Candidatus Andersenbacteria bacterium RIFCSPLOWO2_02_FULL_46_11]OGY39853.1 MAG: hypothetical protein A3G57_02400 [Candidatus Andersenbacteria bacterium RIFCSPLOWO2_12_FULL_45_8]HBE89759.1 hypothetical protein [Candidatus Anderse